MFPLIFCSMCAQKFCCVCTFLNVTFICKRVEDQKTKTIQTRIGTVFEPKIKENQKRSSPKIGAVFVLEKFIAQCKNMSEKQCVCAQQIYACAQSLKPVCARTRAQLRRNTGLYCKNCEKTVLAHEFWGDNQYFESLSLRTTLQGTEHVTFLGTILAWGAQFLCGGSQVVIWGCTTSEYETFSEQNILTYCHPLRFSKILVLRLHMEAGCT